MVAFYVIDRLSPGDRRQPPDDIPSWPYKVQVFVLFGLQLVNHGLLLYTASQLDVSSAEGLTQTLAMLLPTLLLAGVNAGVSGIVVAHELIHRHNIVAFTLGRVLLGSVFYEHFATDHIRGHHPRVGTLEDPVTARFGESHAAFLRRTMLAQWLSAWRLENKRLGEPHSPWLSPRILRHRVLQGALGEIALACGIVYVCGWVAFGFFVAQAAAAVLLLETVNYIEHWGLSRSGKKVVSVDSWDTDNWFTLYALVGLSRHADHHAQASRPYQKLRHFSETAKMPRGYFGTTLLAIVRNRRYRELATEELQRKRLGPFRTEDVLTPLTHLHPSSQYAPGEGSDLFFA
ncbi:MAG: fatty acid desaturase [Polyangiales bacterium]